VKPHSYLESLNKTKRMKGKILRKGNAGIHSRELEWFAQSEERALRSAGIYFKKGGFGGGKKKRWICA